MCHYMHMIQPQKQQLYANFPLSKALQRNAHFAWYGHLIYGLTQLLKGFHTFLPFLCPQRQQFLPLDPRPTVKFTG